MDVGLPVRPWLSSTPIRRPPVSSGRAGAESVSRASAGSGVDGVMEGLCTSRSRLPEGLHGRRRRLFYWFLKWIALGPFLRVIFRPVIEGAENVPDEGPAILA